MIELKGKITIVTNDQLIVVNGEPFDCRLSGGFIMRNGEWAVQFDTNLGVGEIEYTDLNNETINAEVFNKAYGYWLPEVIQKCIDFNNVENEVL